jgi:hypothetical protein
MFKDRKLFLVTVFLIVVSITAYMLLVYIPGRIAEQAYEGARQIGRDIASVFQVTPQVTVNNTVVLQQQTPILELATVSQKFQHHYDWTNTWLGSTKKINIKGTFEAKAGFDLHQRFSVDINSDKAVVILPEPKLLSMEPSGDVRFTDESGVWNWVDAEDRSKAINAFTKDARKYGQEAKFVEQAKSEMEKKLREIFLQHGMQVEFRYSSQLRERLPSF